MPKKNQINVIELFAGVGGFRLGLEGLKGKSSTSSYKNNLNNPIPYKVIYSNQWEPGTKIQYANQVYVHRFGAEGHFEKLIQDFRKQDLKNLSIPCDLLTAGFPCPDFSVASLLKNAKGLKGSKGKLWFEIIKLLNGLKKYKKLPEYILLENVDRMLKSPYTKKGEDFRTILKTLDQLNYNVEWRIINAGDYGFPQKRRRVFVLCFQKRKGLSNYLKSFDTEMVIERKGIIASAFPSKIVDRSQQLDIGFDPAYFGALKAAGIMINGKIYDYKIKPIYEGKRMTLHNVLYKGKIDKDFYLSNDEIPRWRMEKGSKKKKRIKNGYTYIWSEGKIPFPDYLNQPSRTIITSEGGKSVSRIRHVVEHRGKLRRLLPIEVERLCMFPNNFTKLKNMPDNKRIFLMGNALVIGIVERIGKKLSQFIAAN